MRAYGKKRVYGKGITRTSRRYGRKKIAVTTGVKSHKLGRKWREE